MSQYEILTTGYQGKIICSDNQLAIKALSNRLIKKKNWSKIVYNAWTKYED